MASSAEKEAYSTGYALFVILVSLILGAILWPYALNTWLIYFHKPPAVLWWQGALLGIIPGSKYAVTAAILTWIAFLFL